MCMRFLTASLMSAGLLLATGSYPAAGETSAETKLVTKVYPVADLVIPLENAGAGTVVNLPRNGGSAAAACTPAAATACTSACPALSQQAATQRKPVKTDEDKLMKLVTNAIAPKTWSTRGGEGRIDYFSLGMSLVVTQTPDVQSQVQELLSNLRKQLEVEVALELRFVTVTDKCFERVSRELRIEPKRGAGAGADSTGFAYLDDRQVGKFMTALQSNRQTNIMQAPKLTVFNGMESTFNVTDTQFFVTKVNAVQTAGGQNVFVPENSPINAGFQVSMRPAVSADWRYVSLNLNAEETSINKVDLFPVTTFVTPVFEGGALGQPVPFTQFLQQPKLTTQSLHKSFVVPDGGTVLLTGWKPVNGPSQEAKPWFAEVLDTLCPLPAGAKETETVLLLVTPRVIVPENEETRRRNAARGGIQEEEEMKPVPGFGSFTFPTVFDPAPMPRTEERVPLPPPPRSIVNATRKPRAAVLDILASYQQACKEGRLTEAKELARKALAIDPTCFSQNFPKKEREKNESR